MKVIGLIGGMSWESTVVYYQLVNRMVREKLGGLHSAELLMWSFDFARIEQLQAAQDWDGATREMCLAAKRLQNGGAECIVICTNTMHKMADEVAQSVDIPVLHIADATARAISVAGSQRPLLLATRYTMEQDFYTGRLRHQHQIDVQIPDEKDRETVHNIIYNELCQGIIEQSSRQQYLDVVSRYPHTDGVIFGCTEVGLLVRPDDFSVPAFDTTELHAREAVSFSLS